MFPRASSPVVMSAAMSFFSNLPDDEKARYIERYLDEHAATVAVAKDALPPDAAVALSILLDALAEWR